MTTIASLAAEYNMQPYELQAFADLNDVEQSDELNADTEAFIRDLVENTDDDGIYRS